VSAAHGARSLTRWTPPSRGGELARLRDEANARYTELHLLVAVLQENLRDLRLERDTLRAELDAVHDQARRDRATWLWRGVKPNRLSAAPER
jgi:hypothetical protein